MLALRSVFGDDMIDKDDELFNDVVLEVAEVIFIIGSVHENHGIVSTKNVVWSSLFSLSL